MTDQEKNIKGIDANLFGDSMTEKMHEYSPFIEKRLIYQTDNNPNKDYSLGQVEFDSTSAFEGSYTDWRNGYVLIPQVLCVESATDIHFDTQGFDFMVALKNSDMNLINSYEIELDNGSIVKKYDLTNMYVNFVLNSEMTEQEMKSEGKSFGYAKDGTGWMFNNAASIYGEGLCNNCNTDKAVYLSSFADIEPNVGMLERQRIYKNNLRKGSDELFSDVELKEKQYCRIENGVKTKVIYYNAVIPLRALFFLFRALFIGYLGVSQTEKSLQDTFFSVFDVIFFVFGVENRNCQTC
jgi:hypothetical protein